MSGAKYHKLLVSVSILIIVGLGLIGCLPGEATSPPQAPSTPTAAVASNGAIISGRVLWGGGPVAGVTVELRAGAWADPATSESVAQAVSDHSGVYQLEAPPDSGVFGLVAYWPDGADNTAPITPLRVMADDAHLEADVFLERAPETPTPALDADGVLETCRVSDLNTYVDKRNGYCFAYPTAFEAQVDESGSPLVVGPPLNDGVEPLRASLLVEVEVAVQGATLTEIVDGYVRQFAGMNVPAIERTAVALAGHPAELLEGVPGHEGSRDILMLHEGKLFHLMFMPSVRDFPQAATDVQVLSTTVVATFSLMAPDAAGPGQPMPPLSDDRALQRIEIPEAGLALEMPAGWFRPTSAWEWMPSAGSAERLGVEWIDLTPPQEAETALLPQPSQVVGSEDVTLTWGSGRLLTVEVFESAAAGKANASLQSVEMHAIVVVAHGDARRAFDLYASAPDHAASIAQRALLMRMLNSAER